MQIGTGAWWEAFASYMHKARSFIKYRHNKSVHGGVNLFILEGVEAMLKRVL